MSKNTNNKGTKSETTLLFLVLQRSFKNIFACIVTVTLLCGMKSKKCLRVDCNKDFIPSKKKQIYCSTKCRTYSFRERVKSVELPPIVESQVADDANKGSLMSEMEKQFQEILKQKQNGTKKTS